jgi:putative spermidine/putrescine transport system ATP-binding protein
MTVEQNIAFGLKQDRMPKAAIAERVAAMLKLVRLGEFARRKPHQLSGGQRQRVALARSLAKRPKVLLLDEPLGALDKKLREETQFELMDLQHELGLTFIVVTHDQEEAMTMADRIAIMDKGEVMQVATPADIYEAPATRFVADFVGSSNVLPPDFVQRWSGQHRWGSLRPEAIRVARATSGAKGGDGVAARLVSASYLGATTRLALEADGLRLHALVPSGAAVPEQGETVTLSFNRENLHLMEDAG